jgi:serine/threonine protein kinase
VKRYTALKKMKLGKGQSYELVNEYELMAQFNCSNLMKMETCFLKDKGYVKNFYIVMEYMVGIMDLLAHK